MSNKIRKWALRLVVAGLFIASLLIVIIINPILSYANKTAYNSNSIFHNRPLHSSLEIQLQQANELIKRSEFYNPSLQIQICMNDGSKYPELLKALLGRAFAWGFYNKVVLQGTANFNEDYVELGGYKWNLTQLLAHEMTHCLQFAGLGFWNSKPLAKIPNWKWEGYAEYIARQNLDQKDLSNNITRLMEANPGSWEIDLPDGTITPKEYYNYWILVQFCMDIKKVNFKQLLLDTTKEEVLRHEMMHWYSEERKPISK